MKKAGYSSSEVILLLNFTRVQINKNEREKLQKIKDHSVALVAFSFLSEMGGLTLCTGQCIYSFMKLLSQMATSSGYGENSNHAFTPLPHSQQPVVGANKGGCKFHRHLKTITVALAC